MQYTLTQIQPHEDILHILIALKGLAILSCRHRLRHTVHWKYASVSSEHFSPDSYEGHVERDLGFLKNLRLKKDAVPSIFCLNKNMEEDKYGRKRRVENRERKEVGTSFVCCVLFMIQT